jgi:hypothetical protein
MHAYVHCRKIVSYRYFAGGAYSFTTSDRGDTYNGHGTHVAVSMHITYFTFAHRLAPLHQIYRKSKIMFTLYVSKFLFMSADCVGNMVQTLSAGVTMHHLHKCWQHVQTLSAGVTMHHLHKARAVSFWRNSHKIDLIWVFLFVRSCQSLF